MNHDVLLVILQHADKKIPYFYSIFDWSSYEIMFRIRFENRFKIFHILSYTSCTTINYRPHTATIRMLDVYCQPLRLQHPTEASATPGLKNYYDTQSSLTLWHQMQLYKTQSPQKEVTETTLKMKHWSHTRNNTTKPYNKNKTYVAKQQK